MRAPVTELPPTAAVEVTFGSLLPVVSGPAGLLSTLHANRATIKTAEARRTTSIISLPRRLAPALCGDQIILRRDYPPASIPSLPCIGELVPTVERALRALSLDV